MKFDAWKVAAAIMYSEDDSQSGKTNLYHYKYLTNEIRKTNLSTLGDKGKDPAQTLNVTLRDKKINGKAVFCKHEDGDWEINDLNLVRDNLEIQRIVFLLKNGDTENHNWKEKCIKLEKENKELRDIIRQINILTKCSTN